MPVKNKAMQSIKDATTGDGQLVARALEGSKHALASLISRYRDWIYNLAIRMVITPEDAEDITQEILIKIITRLKQYDQTRAAFKTWLYRITVNHIINMKRRGLERASFNFGNYYERMDDIPDREPEVTEEIRATVFDTMINCVMATLICLNRTQRLVIILGVIFNISSKMGAELLNISRANFRKILSRARARLKRFMGRTCSLVNKKARCTCRLKITGLIEQGYRDPGHLVYDGLTYTHLVRDVVSGRVKRFMNGYFYKFNNLFQAQPFWESPGIMEWLSATISSREFAEIFDLNRDRSKN
jgi:RNA polymerase sigma factor (sigma-70 family)